MPDSSHSADPGVTRARRASNPELQGAARRAIDAGLIPSRDADRLWGGRGAGAACVICGVPLSAETVELELEFGVGRSFHLHVDCYAAWDTQRRQPAILRGPAAAGTMTPRERTTADPDAPGCAK